MKALIIVDVQNDFCPGGTLAVKDGDNVVPVINRIAGRFDLVLASRDWHQENSIHFDKWPVHCVRNTPGADYHPDLETVLISQELLKGTGNHDDGYSAFEATNINLADFLKEKGVTDLYIAGLATDYCVKATALDACRKGFHTYVVTDAIKAVNAIPGDEEKALTEMKAAGCKMITSSQL